MRDTELYKRLYILLDQSITAALNHHMRGSYYLAERQLRRMHSYGSESSIDVSEVRSSTLSWI